jgi:hypothetical protein
MNTWTTKDQIIHELVEERIAAQYGIHTRLSLRCDPRPLSAMGQAGFRSGVTVTCLQCLAATPGQYIEIKVDL